MKFIELDFSSVLKVRKFQNESMKSSFLPNYEQKCQDFCPIHHKTEILTFLARVLAKALNLLFSFFMIPL